MKTAIFSLVILISVLFSSLPSVATEAIALDPTIRDSFLRSHLKSHTEDSRHRAMIIYGLLQADSVAKVSTYYQQNPQAREDLYRTYVARARAEAGLDPWRGGWAETGARAGSAAALAVVGAFVSPTVVGAGAAAAGGVAVDAGVSRYFESLDKSTQNQASGDLSKEQIAWLNHLGDTYLKKQPQFAKVSGEIDIGDYKTPPSEDRDVRDLRRHEELQNGQRDLESRLGRKILKATADNQVTREEYEDLKNEVLRSSENISVMVGELQAERRERQARALTEQEEREYNKRRNNVTGSFSAMSTLAGLFGEPRAAWTFGRLGDLSGTLMDLSRTGSAGFKADPIKAVNMYLFAASLMMDLASGPQEGSDQVILRSLQQISLQLSELREEMHQRFNQLEIRLDYYFYETRVDLNRIQESQKSLAEALQLLRSDVSRLRYVLDNGLYALGRQALIQFEAECMGVGVKKEPLRLQSDVAANTCFSKIIAFASGDLSALLSLGSREAGAHSENDFDRESFQKLVSLVARETSSLPVASYPPAHFKHGVTKLTELMLRNPKFAPIALHGSWANSTGVSNYQMLISHGESLDQFHRSMVLQETGSGYRLRSSPIRALLQQYEIQARTVIEKVERRSAALRGGNVPDPVLKWSKGGPVPETYGRLSFPTKKISLCEGTQVRLGEWTEHRFQFAHNPEGRRHKIHEYVSNAVGVSPAFLQWVPASVQWADLARAEVFGNSFQIDLCFRQIDFQRVWLSTSHFQSGPDQTSIRLALTLEMWARYKKPNGEVRSFLVSRLSGAKETSSAFFDPQFTQEGLFSMAWNGRTEGVGENSRIFIYPEGGPEIIYDDMSSRRRRAPPVSLVSTPQRLFPGNEGRYGIVHDPALFFVSTPDAKVVNDLKAFESEFGQLLERNKQLVRESVHADLGSEREEIQSVLWQLDYLLRQGLDMSNPSAQAFYRSVLGGALPSADAIAYQAIEKSPLPSAEALRNSLNEIGQSLEKLSLDTSLKPAVSVVAPSVRMLKDAQRKFERN